MKALVLSIAVTVLAGIAPLPAHTASTPGKTTITPIRGELKIPRWGCPSTIKLRSGPKAAHLWIRPPCRIAFRDSFEGMVL